LEERTLAEAFHDNGYATMHAGKWHLGHEPFYPEYHGFDVNQGGWSQGGPFTGKGYFSPYGNPRLTDGPPGEHLTARLAEEASRFIHAHREEPFFIHLAWYAVHAPLQAPADLVKKYEDKLRTMGRQPGALRETPDGAEPEAQNHAVYAAMVESLDRGVGRVMRAVRQAGLADRTVVLFTSDNGGLSTGDVGLPANEGWPTSNAPLRAGKGWLYEGGVRVPLIVTAPTARKQAISERIVAGTDLYSTALTLAGIDQQEPAPADSVDFSDALQGDVQQREPVYWHYPHYGNQGGRPGSAVRDGDWKLIEWHGATPSQGEVELFNLASDPGEQANLADKETDRRDQLLAKINAWRDEVHAAFPQPNEKVAGETRRAAVSHRLPVDR
jgi:arylsulfatase A-like enzyme